MIVVFRFITNEIFLRLKEKKSFKLSKELFKVREEVLKRCGWLLPVNINFLFITEENFHTYNVNLRFFV